MSHALLNATIVHVRQRPPAHRLQHHTFGLLLDVDKLPLLPTELGIAYNKNGIVSFWDKDHGARNGEALRPFVDQALQQADLPMAATIRLLCMPRVFSYVFNPLSIYFCYNTNQKLFAVLYEVKNTFGDQHCYLFAVSAEQKQLQHETQKGFYVSPLLPMQMHYAFSLRPPADDFGLTIQVSDADGPALMASWQGRLEPLTRQSLWQAVRRWPLQSVSVMLEIHWHALLSWLKGARFFVRPTPPAAAVTIINPGKHHE